MICRTMAAKAFLREQSDIAALILMRIMTGCTIHFTTNKTFAALQQLYLVAVHIQIACAYYRAVKNLQFKISKCIPGQEEER
jgi:hypothetical protein